MYEDILDRIMKSSLVLLMVAALGLLLYLGVFVLIPQYEDFKSCGKQGQVTLESTAGDYFCVPIDDMTYGMIK